MMSLYMPLFMGWLAYSFPSGLAIYFITSNLASIIQYALMGRLDWKNLLPRSLQK
jgi:YidC/Oxa1 family membrane protein insertase